MSAAKAAQPAKHPAKSPRAKTTPATRSLAEWVSLGVSLFIVAAITGLVLYAHLTRSDEPAVIGIQPRLEQVRVTNGSYYLPVEVTNDGGQTLEALEIEFTLRGEGEPETAQVSYPFLADGETAQTVVVFGNNPAEGALTFTFSYLEP